MVSNEFSAFMLKFSIGCITTILTIQDYVVWTDRGERNGIHAGILLAGEKVRGVVHPGIGSANDVITYDYSLQPENPSE